MKDKVREDDFQNKERPSTRLKQFFDIAKNRFVELIKISLLQTVFNMPLIVSLVLFYILVRNSQDASSLLTVFIITSGSFLITLPFSYVGMTGTFYCMKKLAYAEGEFAASSFFIGMREEFKKGILIGLLMGLSTGIAVIGLYLSFVYLTQLDNIVTGFSIAILTIQFIVMLIVSYYAVGQSVVYSNKMRFIYKNSFIMTLIRFPINLLLVILAPGIVVALIAIMEITMYAAIVLIVFFSAFGHLIWMLNVISTFDKFINKEQYPEIYRKGLANIETTIEEE